MSGEPASSRDDRDEADQVRLITARAIRRLGILETMIFAAAAVLAVLAGALAALLVSGATELGFRTVWVVASLLFFVVPGAIAFYRDRTGGG